MQRVRPSRTPRPMPPQVPTRERVPGTRASALRSRAPARSPPAEAVGGMPAAKEGTTTTPCQADGTPSPDDSAPHHGLSLSGCMIEAHCGSVAGMEVSRQGKGHQKRERGFREGYSSSSQSSRSSSSSKGSSSHSSIYFTSCLAFQSFNSALHSR